MRRGCLGGLALLLLGLWGREAEAARSNGERIFPHSTWCPYYFGKAPSGLPAQASPSGVVTFTAQATTQTLTFQSCDADFDPAHTSSPWDVRLTDLVVVRRDVWQAHIVGVASYPPYIDGNCYFSQPPDVPKGRFDRTASYTPAELPFRDTFAPASTRWSYRHATVQASCSGAACLVLAQAARAASGLGLCSSASVTIGGLTVGQDYVVDFDWYVNSGLEIEGTSTLTVLVHDAPGGAPGLEPEVEP